jgi:hypothetical protein
LDCAQQPVKPCFTPIHPPNPARGSTKNFQPKFADTSLKPNLFVLTFFYLKLFDILIYGFLNFQIKQQLLPF